VLDGALHPAWWFNLLTTEPLSFASFSDGSPQAHASIVNTMFDPGVTFDDLAWMRDAWTGPLVVKGIQNVEDAQRVADLGVDGIVVSNHGGRQLDRSVTPLEVLPRIVDAVGNRVEVFLDTGVSSGSDVAAAIALGAKACLVGRAYLYGLMAGGQRGVERAVDIISTEMIRTLQLLGVNNVAELDQSVVRLRQ
jgi:L-lactate dehydrogenase (cytochrome)